MLSTPDNTHLKSLSEERNALDKWTSDLAEGERACRAAELKEREALENKSLSAERFRKAQALLEKLEGELRHTRENRDAASKALEAEKTHAQELRSQLPDSDAELDLPALCTALEARVANRRKLEAQASQAATHSPAPTVRLPFVSPMPPGQHKRRTPRRQRAAQRRRHAPMLSL